MQTRLNVNSNNKITDDEIELFKKAHGLTTDAEAVLFIFNKLKKYCKKEGEKN